MRLSVSFMFRRRATRGAFTLIELLVVLAIISLVTALLLPALKKAKDSANRAVCFSNLRQLAAACILYAQENRDYYPNARWQRSNPLDGPHTGRYADWVKPEPVRKLEDSAIARYVSGGSSRGAESLRKILVCPGDPGFRWPPHSNVVNGGTYWPSYAMHWDLTVRWNSQRKPDMGRRHWIHKMMLAEVEAPMDGTWKLSKPYFYPLEGRPNVVLGNRLGRTHGSSFHKQSKRVIAIRASVAFFDGHVESTDEWTASENHYFNLWVPMNQPWSDGG